jgi:hypothetical protein
MSFSFDSLGLFFIEHPPAYGAIDWPRFAHLYPKPFQQQSAYLAQPRDYMSPVMSRLRLGATGGAYCGQVAFLVGENHW